MEGEFGPYRLIEPLGAGGAGRVYRALGPDGTAVALKTVQAQNRYAAASIRREIIALARIRHPAVIRVRDHGVHEGHPWYAMDLVDGEPLDEWAKDQAPREILRVVAELLAALEVIHSLGIVHRDVSPSNVLVADGHPVLADFGLATPVARPTSDPHESRGSADYRAPEQLRGQAVDARADLYAIGVVLYELIAGHHPMADSGMHLSRAHLHFEPARLRRLVRGIPPALDDVVMGLLSKRRERRPSYAGDVIEVLDGLRGAKTARKPVPTYLYPASFVGRTAEREALEAGLGRVAEGRTELWLVAGASGSGKSRLAAEVALEAGHLGLSVVSCECRAGGGALHGWRGVLDAVADLVGQTHPDLLIEHGPVLAPHSKAIASLRVVAEQPDAPVLRDDLARLRLLDALVETLKILARAASGLLIVIDDLQWADEVTLELLRAMALSDGTTEAIGILGLYRTEEARPVVEALDGADIATWLRLGRLDPDHVVHMIVDMLAMPVGREPLVDQIEARCDGSPFYVSELLRAAVERGVLVRQYGAWRLAPEEIAQLPGTPWEAVADRISRCSPDAMAVLQAAAVLGKQCDGDVLAAVAGREGLAWYEALEELRVRRLLSDDGRRFRFFHDIQRDVAYRSIPTSRLVGLHEAAVAALDDTRPVSPAEHADVAHHLLAAGHTTRARERLAMAARLAQRQFAGIAAIELAREAIALESEPDEDSIDLRYRIAGQISRQAHFDQARVLLGEAVAIAHRIGAPQWVGPLQSRRAIMALRGGYPDEVESAWEAAMAALDDATREGRVDILRDLGAVAREQGRAREARDLFTRALDESDADGTELGPLLGNLALAEEALGRTAEAEALHEQVLAISEARGDVSMMGSACGAMAVAAHKRGDVERARGFYTAAIEHHRRSFQRMLMHAWINNLAELDRQQGRFEAARDGLERTLRWHESTTHASGHAIALANLSSVELELGNVDRAVELADHAVARVGEAKSPLVGAQVHSSRARLAALLGDLDGARAHSDRALELVGQMTHPLLEALVLCGRIHVLLARGEPIDEVVDRVREGAAGLTRRPGDYLDVALEGLDRALAAVRDGEALIGGYAAPDVPEWLR